MTPHHSHTESLQVNVILCMTLILDLKLPGDSHVYVKSEGKIKADGSEKTVDKTLPGRVLQLTWGRLVQMCGAGRC